MLLLEHVPLSNILSKWVPPFLRGPVRFHHSVMIDAYMYRDVHSGLLVALEDLDDDSHAARHVLDEAEIVLVRRWLDLSTGICEWRFELDCKYHVSSCGDSVTVFDGSRLEVLDGVSGQCIKETSPSTILGDGWHPVKMIPGSSESTVFFDANSTAGQIVRVLDAIHCSAPQLGRFERVWSLTIDPLANCLALLCQNSGNSCTYVCTFDLKTGTQGLHLQAEDTLAIAYLQDGTVLALVGCNRVISLEDALTPLDEPFLRLIDIASGNEIARHSCLMWLCRFPHPDWGVHYRPCVQRLASSRSGQTLAAFGYDDENEVEMEFINLSFDMSLCTRKVPSPGYHIHNFAEFEHGCSSLAIVDGAAGHQVLAGSDGTVFSFCASSGDLLWKLPLDSDGVCTIAATIPLHRKSVAGICDTTAALEIPRVQHPIESVLHVDPPALIHEEEAAAFTAVQHADFVQQLCNDRVDDDDRHSADSGVARVWLCKLNRIPKALRTELCEGESLLPCRRALEAAGYHYKLPESGAFVFVHPDEYNVTLDAVCDIKLTPDNVLFTASFELMVEEALLGGGALEAHAWVKSRDRVIIEEDHVIIEEGMGAQSAKATIGDGVPLPIKESTFIGFSLVRNADYDSPRTESTTKVHCPNIANPRRTF